MITLMITLQRKYSLERTISFVTISAGRLVETRDGGTNTMDTVGTETTKALPILPPKGCWSR